jgi:hypothetical protein
MVTAIVAAAAFVLESADFRPGRAIPTPQMASECGGLNRPPALTWTAPPKGTRSFALIVRDPDAAIAGGFYHWVVYDVPATARAFGGGHAGGQIGDASTGRAAYYGPCPPPGPPHRYIFTLYALDVAHAGGNAPLTGPQLETRVRGHVLGRATLEGTAAR